MCVHERVYRRFSVCVSRRSHHRRLPINLTIKQIENAKPREKPYTLADGGGLGLFIPTTGAKLWRWRYRFDGKEKMMALGEYPLGSLKEARERNEQRARQRRRTKP